MKFLTILMKCEIVKIITNFFQKKFKKQLTSALPSAIIQLSEGKKQTTHEREENKMKINSIMASAERNNANGARARKVKEYSNKENHMDYRIRTNKNRKG